MSKKICLRDKILVFFCISFLRISQMFMKNKKLLDFVLGRIRL